jgi:hypothetical protein
LKLRYSLQTLVLVGAAWAQVASEPVVSVTPESMYPAEWPAGPSPGSVPEWARPGRISFARWDGGPIETAKAFLSGWPGFNPPSPDHLYAMTNWYDRRTVKLLHEAGVRMIWVTFSNGFSIPTERRQMELVRGYIEECHRQGIRVMAYQSIANMFWEDMFECVPESKDWVAKRPNGEPQSYPSGDYTKMGRITRYMADMSKPGWREYLRKRVDLAIDAGADGVIYDNNSTHLLEVYGEIYAHAASRKADFLLMGNFHTDTYAFNRVVNAMTTEDGREPGVFAEENLRAERSRDSLVRVDAGYLINNVGLLRAHSALSQGWKPVMIENGGRVVGSRLESPVSGRGHQLAMAEAMSFNVAHELVVEGGFARSLWFEDPEALKIWRAIGRYNRFFANHEQYYVGAHPVASVAMVLDDRSDGVPLLNGLAARGVLYDVLYEHDLTPERLRPYAAVAVVSTAKIRPQAAAVLDNYAARGRKLYRDLPPMDELAAALNAAGPQPVRVDAPPGVLHNITEQKGRRLVHLVNYTLRPRGGTRITVKGRATARLLSPDEPREAVRVLKSTAAETQFEIPSVAIYSLVVLE